MAVVRYGDAGPALGLVAESTGFVQEFNIKTMFDEVEVANNIGETQTFGQFNQRWEGQIVLINKAGDTIPNASSVNGTAVTYALANCGADTNGSISNEPVNVILIDRERKPEQKGAEKYTFNFKAWLATSLH